MIAREGLQNVQGSDLFLINEAQKIKLDAMLREKGLAGFTDLNRPLFGALRRIVQYKEQGIYIPLMEWITGDRDKTYDTPYGKRLGLGANILLGGVGRDPVGMDWERQFKEMQQDPRFKGKFVFINETGTEVMHKAVTGSNFWLETPRHTREASGTSGGRAGLNGVLVIGTATGEILAFVRNGENGWSVSPFEGWDLGTVAWGFELGNDVILRRFYDQGVPLIMDAMTEAADIYYAYREGTSTEMADRMQNMLVSAHEEVDIKEMVRHYGIFLDETLRGTGAAGYEAEREKYERGEGKYGGIDLNPALFQLKIKRDGKGIPLPKQTQPLQSIDIEGFIPVIINVAPVPNLPQSIGILGEAVIEQPAEDDQVQTTPVNVTPDQFSYLQNRRQLGNL
jgi:flavodoxin